MDEDQQCSEYIQVIAEAAGSIVEPDALSEEIEALFRHFSRCDTPEKRRKAIQYVGLVANGILPSGGTEH